MEWEFFIPAGTLRAVKLLTIMTTVIRSVVNWHRQKFLQKYLNYQYIVYLVFLCHLLV
jgi:hypothetical protein